MQEEVFPSRMKEFNLVCGKGVLIINTAYGKIRDFSPSLIDFKCSTACTPTFLPVCPQGNKHNFLNLCPLYL